MKTIIAGGRNYKFSLEDIKFLNSLKSEISEVVCGKAKGADTEGENWARKNNIPVKEFPANWKNLNVESVLVKTNSYGKYNALAGMNRNKEMAEYADALILFNGGSGTENMFKTAKTFNLKIYDRRFIRETNIVHCKKEPYDIYIGRPSKWGNPYSHIKDKKTKANFLTETRKESIEKYKEWITNGEGKYLLKDLHELKGKTLGCWCKPNLECHGDILKELIKNL